MTRVDYLIAGQGLAGTILAWQALSRGRTVLLADPHPAANASHAAAGIVNPILGPRLHPSWRFHDLWALARPFYRRLEQILALPFLHEIPLVRFFTDPAQQERWLAQRHGLEYHGLWAPCPDHPDAAFLCPGAAWLDTTAFLDASAARLPLRRARVDPPTVTITSDGVSWGEIHARCLVFCEGHAIRQNPFFSFIPIRPSRGEILTLHLPGFAESRILHRGKWLVPIGGDRFRAGSTHVWDDATGPTPTSEQAASGVLQELSPLLPAPLPPPPYPLASGVRPMLRQGKPVLGRHPRHPSLAILNGLGAKGVLLAPFFAAHLLDHLESGAPLDPGVDLLPFWKP